MVHCFYLKIDSSPEKLSGKKTEVPAKVMNFLVELRTSGLKFLAERRSKKIDTYSVYQEDENSLNPDFDR